MGCKESKVDIIEVNNTNENNANLPQNSTNLPNNENNNNIPNNNRMRRRNVMNLAKAIKDGLINEVKVLISLKNRNLLKMEKM